jgi:hypothetical protein
MKNLFLLPTDKPSRLHFDSELFISPNHQVSKEINSIVEGRNIYITSDEEIKDVRPHKGKWQLEKGYVLNMFPNYLTDLSECKLVIMTTDQDLIKDGVQAIDDEFLEWLVKNPSCEKVETYHIGYVNAYNIIIPKEEPKQETQGYICPQTKIQCDDECCVSVENCHIKTSMGVIHDFNPKQETLEEFKKRFANDKSNKDIKLDYQDGIYYGIEVGAKWQAEQLFKDEAIQTLEKGVAFLLKKQERMYSEEEVLVLLHKRDKHNIDNPDTFNEWKTPKEWFEQFKK